MCRHCPSVDNNTSDFFFSSIPLFAINSAGRIGVLVLRLILNMYERKKPLDPDDYRQSIVSSLLKMYSNFVVPHRCQTVANRKEDMGLSIWLINAKIVVLVAADVPHQKAGEKERDNTWSLEEDEVLCLALVPSLTQRQEWLGTFWPPLFISIFSANKNKLNVSSEWT